MRNKNSVTVAESVAPEASPRTTRRRFPPGVVLGAVGVAGFSLTLPATRLAVSDLDPWFVAFGRASVAAALAGAFLLSTRAPWPTRAQLRPLAVVALGVVVGFPLFSSLALQVETAAHGAVVIAVLPAATAVAAVARAHERPGRRFWLAAALGLLGVLAFVWSQGGLRRGGLEPNDGFLLAAVVLAAIGYAEGGALSRTLGGAQTISWALLLAAPLCVTAAAGAVALAGAPQAGVSSWLGFGYVSGISMFLAFFAWYAGLARGGVARIGQVQLVQPVLTLAWAALLLGEAVSGKTALAALGVLACVVATQRSR